MEMLRNLVSRPFTILYPREKVPIPGRFRGKVEVDDETCIGCSKCSVVCSVQCISMVDSPREVEFKGKKLMRKKKPKIALYHCIRCGLCERHCPTGAIHLRNTLSESGTDREAVIT